MFWKLWKETDMGKGWKSEQKEVIASMWNPYTSSQHIEDLYNRVCELEQTVDELKVALESKNTKN